MLNKLNIRGWNETTKLSIASFLLYLSFLSPVATFFYTQNGLDYFQILSLESIFVLVLFLFEVPTGIFGDKIGRKKSILVGTFLIALSPLVLLFAKSYLVFAISLAVDAIGFTFLSGTIEAFIYDHLKKKGQENQMKKVMGSIGSSKLLGMAIAPIIGSFIAKDLLPKQFTILIYLMLIAYISAFLFMFTLNDTKEKTVKEQSPITILKNGLSVIKGNRSLLRLIFLRTFSNPFFYVIAYLYQPYFQKSHIKIALFGVIYAITTLISAFVKRNTHKIEDLLGMRKSLILITFLPGLLYIIMAFIFNPVVSILLFVLLESTMAMRKPLFSGYQNIHIPSNVRATVLSFISMFTSFYLIGMRLLIGKISDVNISYAFILMGVIVTIGSFMFRIKEVKE